MTRDNYVVIGCLCAATFYGGLWLGMDSQPKQCPVVVGEKVISTIDSHEEQVCIYVRSYGMATKKRKI